MFSMCVVCFNSQWRAVVIGTVSASIALGLILSTVAFRDAIDSHLQGKLLEQGCVPQDVEVTFGFDFNDTNSTEGELMSPEEAPLWHDPAHQKGHECVYIVFDALFPWPLWAVLGVNFLLNTNLVVSALYKFLPGVTVYLALDSLFVGLLAASLCLAFFPSGLLRISLLTLLFPLFALALCAWMNVFGFYLRLEDRERRKIKRREAARAIEQEKEMQRSKDFQDMVLGKTEKNIVLNKLPSLVDNGFQNEAFTPA